MVDTDSERCSRIRAPCLVPYTCRPLLSSGRLRPSIRPRVPQAVLLPHLLVRCCAPW